MTLKNLLKSEPAILLGLIVFILSIAWLINHTGHEIKAQATADEQFWKDAEDRLEAFKLHLAETSNSLDRLEADLLTNYSGCLEIISNLNARGYRIEIYIPDRIKKELYPFSTNQ